MDGIVHASNKFVNWSIGFAMLMSLLAATSMTNFVEPSLFNDLALFRDSCTTGATSKSIATISQLPMTSQLGLGGIVYGFTTLTGWQIAGILILKMLLCFGIGITCHGYSVRNQVSFGLFSVFGLLAVLASVCFEVTQLNGGLFSAALLVALLDCLNRDVRIGGFWIWASLPILLAWNHLHPSVIVGLGVLLAYGVGKNLESLEQSSKESVSRLYLLVVAGFGIATLGLNPQGWQIVFIFFSSLGETSILSRETSHIWHGNLIGQLLFVGLIGFASLGFCLARSWPIFESLTLLLTSTIAMIDTHFISLFLVAWLCLIPPLVEKSKLAELWKGWLCNTRHRIAFASIVFGCISLGFASHCRFWQVQFPTQAASSFSNAPVYPVDAIDFLKESEFQGRVLVPSEFTGYLFWRLPSLISEPRINHAVSNATHSTMSFAENRQFYLGAENWRELLESHSPTAFLVPKSAPLHQLLKQEKGCLNAIRWKPVFEDLSYVVLAKEERTSVAKLPNSLKSVEQLSSIVPPPN